MKELPMTKEVIAKWVKRDIETLYSLAYELLSTPGIIDILAEKLYQRTLAEKAKNELEQAGYDQEEMEKQENVELLNQLHKDANV